MVDASPLSGTASVPLVSIVVPVHDGRRYLREALESCVAQDYPQVEVVVVDDASTDGSSEIAAEFARRHDFVRVERHDVNQTLPVALNAGFATARGRLLTWTSDDNLFRPHAISRMAAALDTWRDVEVVYADMTRIGARGEELGAWNAGPVEELPFRNPVGACFLYRREVQEALGGYAEDLFTLEDFDFWIRAACRFRMRRIPEDLYRYRVHDASLSQRLGSGRDELARRCLSRRLAEMPRALRSRSHAHLAHLLRASHHSAGAVWHAAAAFGLAPLDESIRRLRNVVRRIRTP